MLDIVALCFLSVPRSIDFCLRFLCFGGTVCHEGTERGGRGFLGCGLFFGCYVCFGDGFLNACSYSAPATYLPSQSDLFPA